MMTELNNGSSLIDGEERNRRAPATFHIPTKNMRKKVTRGMYCRIGIDSNDPEVEGERFWVIVKAWKKDMDTGRSKRKGHYIGEVNNDLVMTFHHGIKFGDIIEFEPKHILDIMTDAEFEKLMISRQPNPSWDDETATRYRRPHYSGGHHG